MPQAPAAATPYAAAANAQMYSYGTQYPAGTNPYQSTNMYNYYSAAYYPQQTAAVGNALQMQYAQAGIYNGAPQPFPTVAAAYDASALGTSTATTTTTATATGATEGTKKRQGK